MNEPALELCCSGDPRAMGVAQGAACAPAVGTRLREVGVPSRRRAAFSLRPLVSGPVLGRGPGREIVRHYTHLAERIAGLAHGAGTGLDELMDLHLRVGRGLEDEPLCAEAVGLGAGGALARSLPDGASLVLRRSRPEVGFRSLELTLPWLAGSLGGVNESGVAVLFAPREAGVQELARPPAWLLVQECLQRFAAVEGCLDWCLSRVSEGAGAVLLADSSGALAVVDFASGRPPAVSRGATALAGGLASARGALSACVSGGVLDPKAAARVVPDTGWLVLDPGARRLRLLAADGVETAFALED